MRTDLRHQVIAVMVFDAGPPAKMIQAKIARLKFFRSFNPITRAMISSKQTGISQILMILEFGRNLLVASATTAAGWNSSKARHLASIFHVVD